MERTLTSAALSSMIANRADLTVLDVRRRPAFEADPQMIPGALWRNPEEVAIWADSLNRNRSVVVYCVHGHEVSQEVVGRLRALGFQAALLDGGIEAWKASGRSVSRTEVTTS
ncbi:MAG TPA: rhodanese-like domain-containing protein [Geminicoccaceae bacterium]